MTLWDQSHRQMTRMAIIDSLDGQQQKRKQENNKFHIQ